MSFLANILTYLKINQPINPDEAKNRQCSENELANVRFNERSKKVLEEIKQILKEHPPKTWICKKIRVPGTRYAKDSFYSHPKSKYSLEHISGDWGGGYDWDGSDDGMDIGGEHYSPLTLEDRAELTKIFYAERK